MYFARISIRIAAVFIALAVSFPLSVAVAQLPGDCNGNGSVNIDDATFLVAYLVQDGTPPQLDARSNCDCDNNPGISLADIVYLQYHIVGIIDELFPPTGTKLTRGSRTLVYTVGRADGAGNTKKIEIRIAVEPDEAIAGFLIPFSFAPGESDADISIDSVSFAESILDGHIFAQFDNFEKKMWIFSDPLTPPSLAGGTRGLLASVYFSQNSPGTTVALLTTSTDRLYPLLFPEDLVEEDGARVFYPAFAERPIGDVDCSYTVDIDDVVQTIEFIFSGGTICYWR